MSLALAVMQRRLVSSIFAIKNTLYKRWIALQGIVDEVSKNPNIWKQRQKLEELDVDSIDQYDDLEDDERVRWMVSYLTLENSNCSPLQKV